MVNKCETVEPVSTFLFSSSKFLFSSLTLFYVVETLKSLQFSCFYEHRVVNSCVACLTTVQRTPASWQQFKAG